MSNTTNKINSKIYHKFFKRSVNHDKPEQGQQKQGQQEQSEQQQQ